MENIIEEVLTTTVLRAAEGYTLTNSDNSTMGKVIAIGANDSKDNYTSITDANATVIKTAQLAALEKEKEL